MQGKLKGTVNSKKGYIHISVDIVKFDEDGCRIIYCPALNVVGYGHSEEEAEHSFSITLHEFLDYAVEHDTLHQELESLGWKLTADKVKPPVMSDIISHNKELRRIVDKLSYVKNTSQISLPAFA